MSIKYYDKSGATPEEKLLAGISPVDAILSPTSKNAIQNKAVYNALRDKLEAATTDLINYYLKTDVYNKSEVRALIGAVETLTMEVVSSLPVSDISTTTIYLLKPTGSNVYDEYVYINDAWVKIGTTDMDLSGYMLTADFNVAIADYFTKAEINNMLNSYYTKAEINADFYNKDSVDDLLDAKQDTLTFDNAPTTGSDNPVKSGGIKTALDAKQNTLTFDSTPTEDSSNPVTSDGIYYALLTKAGQGEVNDIVNIYGSKNLLNTSIVTIPSGLSVTLNKDKSVTINGTNTSAGEIRLFSSTGAELQYLNGCILSGITTGSNSTYFLRVVERTTPWTHYARVYTKEQIISGIPNDNRIVDVGLYVYSNQTFNSFTFYPMIRLGTIVDPTYQPYAMTNQQMTPYVQAISNPNLLDNPWFTVNQRGRTTYGNSMNGFSVDRWYKNLNISLDVIDNGVRLTKKATSNPTLYQKIEASPYLLGKTVTFSVMTTDGKIRSCTGTFPSTFPSSGNVIVVNFDDDIISFRLQAVSTFNPYFIATLDTENCAIDEYLDIRAAKLELGTASTLAMDTAPNYQQELAKCQRYFVRIGGTTSGYPIALGRAHNATQGRYLIHLPVPMRSSAVVTCSDFTKVRELCDHQQITPTSFSAGTMDAGGYLAFYTTTTGLVTDELCGLLLQGEYLDISADL